MAFGFELLRDQKGDGPMSATIRVDRHWYITEDGARVVEEGVPGGRWLWAAPGQEVNRAEAERLGAAPQPEPEPVEPPEPDGAATKQRRAPATKQRTRAEDK